MLNRNHKYIKFILEKLKSSLYSSGFDITGNAANKALGFLISSDDVLRDIFILSRYKQCGSLCSYLLFVYKKLDENSLKYENLPINIEYDVEYLKRIVIGNFKLSKTNGEVEENQETQIFSAEADQQPQWEVSEEISESKFKVGEIERDIVTEEFSEDEIDISQFKDLNPEDEEKIEEIISVSLEEVKESFADELKEPETQIEEQRETKEYAEEENDEIIETKEEAFDLSDLIETKQPEQNQTQNELIDDEKQAEEVNEEKIFLEEEQTKDTQREEEELQEESEDESILEISSEHLELSDEEKTEPKDKTIEYEDTHILEENETLPLKNEDLDEELPPTDEKNKKYVEFEKKLVTVNAEMSLCFDELESLIKNYDDNNSIIKDKSAFILQKADTLAKATGEMTFEIISNMYNFMGNYFDNARNIPFEVRQKDISIFSYSLRVIEKFILEEDFSGIEKVLGDYHEVEKYAGEMEKQKRALEEQEPKNEIIDIVSPDTPMESSEEIINETKNVQQEISEDEQEREPEKVLYEKKEIVESEATASDSRKKMMMVLKAEIMELEIIFKSIDEIEGEYKIYEGLRKLSKTYNILKKTVVLSKRLNMKKLARLSEACYIFIKFIQNYRLSPFDNDIKQIFNYIIYNYKLIALDKPTKDFEEFVFYLNDPVKIFTQKKKN
jgi:hypothetical protein